jgi:NitT/TauT family transport system substrate-binding protein
MADTTSTLTPVTLGSKASWIAYLAEALGYFEKAGLDVTLLNKQQVKEFEAGGGTLPVQVNWLQHAVYGTANGKPQIAVMLLHDATGITIMIADQDKDVIRSAADFAGKRVAEGASHSSKGILTNYLATRAGLPSGSYTPVFSALEGRREAVAQALEENTVDVLTFMEPMTSFVRSTGKATVLYDFGTRESTLAEIGLVWPAESLLVNPDYLRENRDTVQKIVDAMVQTMEFVHDSSPEEVAGLLADTLLAGKDSAEALEAIAKRWPTLSHDYDFTPESVQLVIDAIKAAPFDDSASGQTRAKAKEQQIEPESLYDNSFVVNALQPLATGL